MTLTPEQYTTRAAAEKVFKSQAAQTPPDIDSLRGCLMMAVQIAQMLKLPLKDLQALAADEHGLWVSFIEVRASILAKRKEKR